MPEAAALGAAERANGRGSRDVAASLVELTKGQCPKPCLVWAVDTKPVRDGTFLVELVNAKTGGWFEGDSGYHSLVAPPAPGRPWTSLAVVSQRNWPP